MNFASDNAGPVHPRVISAIIDANEGHVPAYGTDRWTEEAVARIREIFEAPDAAVHLVATGTAANSLALAALARPWDAVFCTEMAHIHEDECNAPEAFTGGAKLLGLPAPQAKLTPEVLRPAMARLGSVHGPQVGPVSITQATEKGTVHSLDEIRALTAVAREFGARVHMDGARFANALVALDCTPAEMTWKAGVDALSFGGTKNGLMGVEAVILFDPAQSWEMELRRKRAAHLFSKGRYLGAQMAAYLTDGLWLEMARSANSALALLVEGLRSLGVTPEWEPDANLVFVRLPRAMHQRLRDAGATYHLWDGPLEEGDPDEPLLCRLVCDWSLGTGAVDRFLAVAAGQPVPAAVPPC
ncbi:low specificity L-threonine aldolase [Rubellimicrobium rubrum]|uniref:Low specificity L-threonine aldolase n=1 Tax=Rubellimicrobium rubrum TaxID=2585369 RepID=A0A5C4MZ40_9RHOB|nr:beta-eliminating lyase-related protein [Rubellimicrobium rubrum]TNC50140.1 low specificity L-threonine aldolase [Rubellimicrobium rubrum]